MAERLLVEAVNDALHVEMERDDSVMVMGEDVGKLGGVFRATAGLQERFGVDRCVDTPLAEAGILGALPGVLGSLMALEVIREIVGFGEGLVGRLLMVDARSMRFETLSYAWDPNNPLNGIRPTIKDLSQHRG